MELADNTYLDGDGESALKAVERAGSPDNLTKNDMADIILVCTGALRGVVRELID